MSSRHKYSFALQFGLWQRINNVTRLYFRDFYHSWWILLWRIWLIKSRPSCSILPVILTRVDFRKHSFLTNSYMYPVCSKCINTYVVLVKNCVINRTFYFLLYFSRWLRCVVMNQRLGRIWAIYRCWHCFDRWLRNVLVLEFFPTCYFENFVTSRVPGSQGFAFFWLVKKCVLR
jgi:hypothetical protein